MLEPSIPDPLWVSVGEDATGLPVLTPATPPSLLVFDDSDAAVDLCAHVLFEALVERGWRRHRIIGIDPASAGVVPELLGVLGELDGFDHTLVFRQEVHVALQETKQLMERRARVHMRTVASSYLAAAPDGKLPSIVIFADLRHRFLDRSVLGMLVDIIRFGPRFGVGVVAAMNPRLRSDLTNLLSGYELKVTDTDNELRAESAPTVLHLDRGDPWVGDHVWRNPDGTWSHAPSGVQFTPRVVDRAQLRLWAELVGHEAAEADRDAVDVLTEDVEVVAVEDGVQLRLGVTGDGALLPLTLGDADPHALVIGRSGSGKSTLLHQLLTGVVRDYDPSDVQLWVLDLKGGNEFSGYDPGFGGASPPHLRRLVLDSEPALARESMGALEEEMQRRSRLFRQHRLRDFRAARDMFADLPRIVVLVDEFHGLLVDVQDELLDALMRQGRSYGIHLLLASQALSGTWSVRAGIAQATARVALGLDGERRREVLGVPVRSVPSRAPGDESAQTTYDPRGTGWMVSSVQPIPTRFGFPAPDHEALDRLRPNGGAPLAIISGVYANLPAPASAGGLVVGVDARHFAAVELTLGKVDTAHVAIAGDDDDAVAAIRAQAARTWRCLDVPADADLAVVLSDDRIVDTLVFAGMDGRAPVDKFNTTFPTLLAAAAARGVHLICVASTTAALKRAFGATSSWQNNFRWVVALTSSGWQLPHRFAFRPAPARAALVDVAAETTTPLILFGS